MLRKFRTFIQEDIWRIRVSGLPQVKARGIGTLRIILSAAGAFREHQCQLRASALTFFSLLSIVPVVAMAFGIAKGFEFEKILQEKILERLPGQEEILLEVFEFANSLLANTKGGLIAGVGVILLFWTIIKVLGNVESSFNDIWAIRKERPISRKITDYLSIMLVAPVLLVISSSITVFVTTQLTALSKKFDVLGVFAPIVFLVLQIAPYVIMWVLFGFLYVFMPNTKVSLKSGIFAGIIAGTVYCIVQFFYIKFQVGVAKYNAIYGSFAALPLFLVWIQTSWLIVLAGAELSCAHQNADMLEYAPDSRRASASLKRILSLRVVNYLSRNFSSGDVPVAAVRIAEALDIPLLLVSQILEDLRESGILVETADQETGKPGYLPARDTDTLTIKYVIDALDRRGVQDIPVARTEEMDRILRSLNAFSEFIEKSPDNLRLKDI